MVVHLRDTQHVAEAGSDVPTLKAAASVATPNPVVQRQFLNRRLIVD